jgi:hypothetical protein
MYVCMYMYIYIYIYCPRSCSHTANKQTCVHLYVCRVMKGEEFLPPSVSQLPPPLRLHRRPRPAATALCAGLCRAYKSWQPEHRRRARLAASSSWRRRLPPPLCVNAHVRASLAARRRLPQRLVPLQRGGQHLDGAVPVWLPSLPAQRHGLRGDARRDALRLRRR